MRWIPRHRFFGYGVHDYDIPRPVLKVKFALARGRRLWYIVTDMANDYDPNGFNTLTLRVDSATKTATVEGPARLHYMDALTVVVSGLVTGAPASLLFAVVDSERNALATAVSGSAWAAVPNAPGKVYAKYSLDTAAAQDLSASLALGTPAEVRMYLRDPAGRTLLDQPVEFYPCPFPVDGGFDPSPSSALVLKADIAEAVAAVQAMPSFNVAHLEARLNMLLTKLLEATV